MARPVTRPFVFPVQSRAIERAQSKPLPNVAQQPLMEGRVSNFKPNQSVTAQEAVRMVRLLPTIADAAHRHGIDGRYLAAVVMQESRGINYLNHSKAQGGFGTAEDRGLVGLNDKGLMPAFERFIGQSYGRASSRDQKSIPERAQIEFLAYTLAARSTALRSMNEALREWHAGAGGRNKPQARNYEASVLRHMNNLFPSGQFPTVSLPTPAPQRTRDHFEPT